MLYVLLVEVKLKALDISRGHSLHKVYLLPTHRCDINLNFIVCIVFQGKTSSTSYSFLSINYIRYYRVDLILDEDSWRLGDRCQRVSHDGRIGQPQFLRTLLWWYHNISLLHSYSSTLSHAKDTQKCGHFGGRSWHIRRWVSISLEFW